MKSHRIACIIPARLNSKRFPEKLLARLGNKPLLAWAWEAAVASNLFDTVTFAVDHEKLARTIESFGGRWIMTSSLCQSGTNRIIEVMEKNIIDADIWVNWQADEPFITASMIQELLQSTEDQQSDIWTLKKKITDPSHIANPAIAKVVCNAHDYALYFSRSTIPCMRDNDDIQPTYYKHIGLYAYRSSALRKLRALPPSCPLEEAEKLEQLRFLYYGLAIKTHNTLQEVIGIDTPRDLEQAEHYIRSKQCNQNWQIQL